MRIRLKGINSITKRLATARAGPIGMRGRVGHSCAANPARRSSSHSFNEAAARKVTAPYRQVVIGAAGLSGER